MLNQDLSLIYFISKERSSHTHAQAYSYSLITKNEKRLVYQDGEIFDLVPGFERNQFFYSSNTDELKERPPMFYKPVSDHPMTEVYSYEGALDFKRHTKHPGFDGQLRWWVDRGVLYVSHNNGTYRVNWISKSTSQVLLSTKYPLLLVGVSESNVRAWVEKDRQDNTPIQYLHLSQDSWARSKKTKLPFEILSPRWAGSSHYIIGHTPASEDTPSKIVSIDTQKSCWGYLVESNINLVDPYYDSIHERIYYAAQSGEEFQISFLSRKPTPTHCSDINPSDKKD